VWAAAEQARVELRPRRPRVFDEVLDIVNFDLVLVLDHFDLTEVTLFAVLAEFSFVLWNSDRLFSAIAL
jgi:hypothetical protein